MRRPARRSSRATRASRAKWRQFAEMGLLGLTVPESFGGAEMTFAEVAVVLEAFGRSLVLEPFVATAVLGTNAARARRREEQKQAILPGVCEGETFLAVAALEPGRATLSPSRRRRRPPTVTECA